MAINHIVDVYYIYINIEFIALLLNSLYGLMMTYHAVWLDKLRPCLMDTVILQSANGRSNLEIMQRYCPCVRESTGHRRIPIPKEQ